MFASSTFFFIVILCLIHQSTGFSGLPALRAASLRASGRCGGVGQLDMAGRDDEEALIRSSRSQRSAGAGDRVVELKRPLGLVLDQDEKGNVYVESE